MEERTYVFFVSHGGDSTPERIEKTEAELTRYDREMLLGDAINSFNKMPQEQKMEFIQRMIIDNNG